MSKPTVIDSPYTDSSRNQRTATLAVIYAVGIVASFYAAYEVRFDFVVPETYQAERVRLVPWVVGIKLVFLIAARQLGTLLTYFSIPDLVRLLWAMAAGSMVLLLPRLLGWTEFGAPRGVMLIDFLLSFSVLAGGRLLLRVYRERVSGGSVRPSTAVKSQVQRIAIVGAGDAGAALAKEFLSHPSRGFRPVMFFDDDPTKHGRSVHGIPVIGRPEALDRAKDIGTLAKAVIAMPAVSARRIREVVGLFTERGIKVETLPTMAELASGKVRASRIRPVEVQDLLGREAIKLDSSGIRDAIEGRCVMVTGAGGSIGSELCRQIAALNPQRLLLVEQSEGSLFTIEQELIEIGLGSNATPLVADILDRDRIEHIFGHYRPDVVFHAAAHKHVFMMERQPAEAIKNNVLGTRLLAEVALKHGVEAFTLISTDKAINPTNVMGATKRLAEIQLMAIAANASASTGTGADVCPVAESSNVGHPPLDRISVMRSRKPEADDTLSVARGSPRSLPAKASRFMAVRFGNVLGSSGSVIPIFKRQIANGGPVTVTHPDVTRYFMTIPEAVGLVLQSFVQGKGGEIFVLDMGQPVKIVDLAKQMIELSGFRVSEDIEIKFTGLKPGEKLFEELQHHTEEYAPTEHPRIMRFTTTATFNEADVQELQRNLQQYSSNELKSMLQRLVPEYKPFLE